MTKIILRKNIRLFFPVLLLVLLGVYVLAEQQNATQNTGVTSGTMTKKKTRKTIDYKELGDSVDVIGPLGCPLGHVIRIEGHLVPEEEKGANFQNNYLEITKVEEKAIKPIRIYVHPYSPKKNDISKDEVVKLIGFQNGHFTGLSSEASSIFPAQDTGFYFEVDFIYLNDL